MSALHFNKNLTSKLKARGYTFQKLYAADYKTYRKKFNRDMTIWLWVKGSLIEINDWHEHTGAIIDFYKTNCRNLDGEYVIIFVNRKTSEIIIRDKDMAVEAALDYEAYIKRWEDWRSIFISFKQMSEIIKELEFLTSQQGN